MPLAPGLFSTIMLPPNALPALSAIDRITASVDPPAGQGQISRIGRAGKAGIWARAGKATAADEASTACTKCRRVRG
jgi:hypothetical protein